MGQVGSHQDIVAKLFDLYKEKGFLYEEEALSMMTASCVSLVGINRVTDKLIALGVIFSTNSVFDDDEDNDRTRTDFETIYAEVLEISPRQRMFIDYIRNIKPPQNREWRLLITQMKSGNEYAFNRLFDMYLRIAVRTGLKFYKESGYELDDAIQEGSMGLIRGIRQYDSSKHGNIGSYLPLWIQQYIGRALADKSRTIRLPVHVYDTVQKLIKLKEKMFKDTGRKPSYSDIATKAQIPIEKVVRLLEATQTPISLEVLLDEANEEFMFKYLVTSAFEDEVDSRFIAKTIRDSMETLTEREKQVLILRYGLYDGQERTLEELGAIFNVTRERVRQIEAKVFRKLRHPTRARYFKDLL